MLVTEDILRQTAEFNKKGYGWLIAKGRRKNWDVKGLGMHVV